MAEELESEPIAYLQPCFYWECVSCNTENVAHSQHCCEVECCNCYLEHKVYCD